MLVRRFSSRFYIRPFKFEKHIKFLGERNLCSDI